jgi:hypothetical protein
MTSYYVRSLSAANTLLTINITEFKTVTTLSFGRDCFLT